MGSHVFFSSFDCLVVVALLRQTCPVLAYRPKSEIVVAATGSSMQSFASNTTTPEKIAAEVEAIPNQGDVAPANPIARKNATPVNTSSSLGCGPVGCGPRFFKSPTVKGRCALFCHLPPPAHKFHPFLSDHCQETAFLGHVGGLRYSRDPRDRAIVRALAGTPQVDVSKLSQIEQVTGSNGFNFDYVMSVFCPYDVLNEDTIQNAFTILRPGGAFFLLGHELPALEDRQKRIIDIIISIFQDAPRMKQGKIQSGSLSILGLLGRPFMVHERESYLIVNKPDE